MTKKIYESIRWTIAIILPAIGVFVVTLDSIWGLKWPAQEISLTLDALGLFLGSIFGISKIRHDHKG